MKKKWDIQIPRLNDQWERWLWRWSETIKCLGSMISENGGCEDEVRHSNTKAQRSVRTVAVKMKWDIQIPRLNDQLERWLWRRSETFKYLGSTISEHGGCEDEVRYSNTKAQRSVRTVDVKKKWDIQIPRLNDQLERWLWRRSETFKYLGSTISENGGCEEEVRNSNT